MRLLQREKKKKMLQGWYNLQRKEEGGEESESQTVKERERDGFERGMVKMGLVRMG